MACRVIDNEGDNFIRKIIPFDSNVDAIIWPSITQLIIKPSILDDNFTKCNCNNRIKQAVYQQYNEILLYETVACEDKKILAPQCDISYSEGNNLPIIIYPRFTPLFTDEEVWKYNDEEILCLMGWRCSKLGISEQNLSLFLEQVKDLCSDYNLREDDIFKNPSNIGYHPIFGLRIIDYGLANNNNSCILIS